MGKVLTTLVLLVVALVAAVLVGPSFVDWNQYKSEITAEAKKATGRELTIAGDVSLALLPSPALSAERVSLANIEGGSQPEMLALDALKIQVAFLPLLGGRIQVQSVSLVEPQILLEVLPDGRANWDFEAEMAEAAESEAETQATSEGESEPDGAAGEDFTVRVDNFEIERGVLIYRDALSGQEERLDEIDARIVAESLRGPFAVEGELTTRGTRTRIEATVGQLPDAGATTFNVTLGLPNAATEVTMAGTLSRHPESFELRGKLKGEGENLAALVGLLADGADQQPVALGNAFTLEGTIEADDAHFSASDLRVGLGKTAIEGEASVALGPPTDLRVKLSASRLDLDELLVEASPGEADSQEKATANDGEAGAETAEGADAQPAAAAPQAEAAIQAFSIPADLQGSIELEVGALVHRGQVVRQIRVNADMAEGRVQLKQALALLPGGSDVSLSGEVTQGEQGPRFVGRLESASDNLRGVLQWLGAPVAEVPADRLRKMSLSTRIDATLQQLSLSELDLRVDLSRVAGGVVVALRERPGLGIGLALDTLNLDAYLPRPGAAVTTEAGDATAAEGEAGPEEQAAQGEPTAQETADRSDGPLNSFDANLNLRVGSLTYQGQTARDIVLQGTLQKGNLSIKQAQVADLAGSALTYSGQLSGLAGRPTMDGTIDLKIADPVKLAALAGVDPGPLARFGAFNLAGNLKGSLDELAFNSKLAMLGGRFGLAGTAKLLSAPLGFDVTLEAQHPDMARLTAALTGGSGLGAGLGGVDVKARLAGTPSVLTISSLSGSLGPMVLNGGLGLDLGGARPVARNVDLTVAIKHKNLSALSRAVGGPSLGTSLGGIDIKGKLKGEGDQYSVTGLSGIAGPLGLSGELKGSLAGGQPSLGEFNLNVRLKHKNLSGLMAAAGLGSGVDPSLGGVDMGAHVFGNAARVDLRDLRGSLGPIELSGTANVALDRARPLLTADLTTGELPLSRLMGGRGGAGGSGGTGAGSLSPRWSTSPIDLKALQGLDANLKLKSKAISHDKFRLANADFAGSLSNGLLDVSHLNGTMFGGAVQIRGKVDSNGTPAIGLALTAIEIESSQLINRMAKFDRISGPVTLNANLSSRGRSEAELISALSGNGDIAGQIVVAAKAEEAAGAALLSVLGDQIKEIRGLAQTGGSLFQSFAGTASQLTGTFQIQQGLVRTNDLRLDGRDAVALTQGSASLPAWLVDSRTDVYRNQNPNAPFITATVTGQLDSPNTKIGGQIFQRQPEAPPSGGTTEGGGLVGPSPTPSGGTAVPQGQPQQVTPQDLLEGLLNKLNQ